VIAEQLQTALTEAKESVDRIYRQEALEYFKLLSEYVKRNEKKIQVRNRRHEAFGGYLITPQNLRTRRTYPDLYIVLAYQGQMAGIGHKSTDIGTLRYIVLPVLIAPFGTKHLATRITGAKKIFVHEFIHYLDQHRYKGQVPESGAMLRKKAFGAYYNSPAEFNAFYQEGANEVLDTVRTVQQYAEPAKPGTLASFVGNYRTFEKRFLKSPYFNKDFLDSLNQKYKKKLMQRFYDLYQEIKKETG
jgi:hypothetical protein